MRSRPIKFEVDFLSTWGVVHDEEMKFVEFVLLDEEVDDTSEDDR